MKSYMLILIAAITLLPTAPLWAIEGMNHDEHMEAMVNAQKDDAPVSQAVEVGNKICPVSGDKVPVPGQKSAMGEVVKYEYKGKAYNLCCKMCIKDFQKNPEKYSKIADAEVAKEKNPQR